MNSEASNCVQIGIHLFVVNDVWKTVAGVFIVLKATFIDTVSLHFFFLNMYYLKIKAEKLHRTLLNVFDDLLSFIR